MEDAFVIKGGKKLRGEVKLSGAKNVALKVIIAALLFDEKVTLQNIPSISDVTELLNLIESLGGKAGFVEENTVVVDGRSLKLNKVDLLYASKIRVSFMLFAPLLYKFNHCFVPNPGGCRIGARPIDRTVDGMKKMNIDYLYNSSEIDQNHKRNHNIEIYHKSPVFTLQCIMDKPMILNESSHIIVPFKIVDVVKILDTPETGKQFLEIRDKILTKYYEKIKDTINLEKHKTDCHIKCMYGKVNDPVFDQIVVQMYMSCIVAFLKLTDKIKKILDDNIFTRYFYEQIFKMVNSINIFSISCCKCLKYYKAQALIINSAQFYDSIVECLESVSLLIDETNYLMTNFKNLFKRARNKYNVDIINCAQVYIEIDSEMREISDKYIKIEKFIKQKCISSTKTPDEHIEGFALDNSCDEIIKTLSNLATIKRNVACAKANVEHIETKSKDNDRSNKNVKKALINKGTRAFLDDKKIIHDSENKIKEIMNSI